MLRNILAAVLIAALPIILLLSDRPWFLSDQQRAVAHVADIPEGNGPILSDLDRIVRFNGVHVVRQRPKAEQLYVVLMLAGRLPPPRVSLEEQRPRFGRSIRELSFLAMPFAWWSEYGDVLYVRNRYELIEAPLTDAAMAQFRKEVGSDLAAAFIFPFWAHAWGWLYVGGLALWLWLRHRWIVRRRAELGMI